MKVEFYTNIYAENVKPITEFDMTVIPRSGETITLYDANADDCVVYLVKSVAHNYSLFQTIAITIDEISRFKMPT